MYEFIYKISFWYPAKCMYNVPQLFDFSAHLGDTIHRIVNSNPLQVRQHLSFISF